MDLYLVRHAHAGSRQNGHRDRYRPLSDKGRLRAEQIVSLLAQRDIGRILSSPATRCVQTVNPLADTRGLEVEEYEELWEGSDVGPALELLGRHVAEGLVACSHGDIIPELIDHLGSCGVPLRGHGCEKGSIWILSHDGRRWTAGRKLSKNALTLD